MDGAKRRAMCGWQRLVLRCGVAVLQRRSALGWRSETAGKMWLLATALDVASFSHADEQRRGSSGVAQH
eukprot:6167824-Pleurochrysis_carterae.AAC.1